MQVSDLAVNRLEVAIREKLNMDTNFGDEVKQMRHMEQLFKFFDSDGSGCIDIEEFKAAMMRMNFVGVQREIDGLFHRYDDNCDGTIDYLEFSQHILGQHPTGDLRQRLKDAEIQSVVERVRRAILSRDEASGYHGLNRILMRMDVDKSKNVDREEFMEGIQQYIDFKLTRQDMDTLMRYFDTDQSGRISIDEFYRGIRGTMSESRKYLIRELFLSLDKSRDGCLELDEVIDACDPSHHPDVKKGLLTEREAVEHLMSAYATGEISGKITWIEFLGYYKDLSACLSDDDEFIQCVRDMWKPLQDEDAKEEQEDFTKWGAYF
jgi:Ca2+-binding EF-hand superfamily protein